MGNAFRAWFVVPWLWVCSSAAFVPYLFADEVVSPEALYDKSRALIIGIEHYPQGKTVPGAVEEAKQVAQAFRHIGFEDIVELYNKDATGRRVQQALTELFAKKVVRSGRVVVFFVGQTGSTRDGKGREVGYLVPADAQSNAAKSLSLETIKDLTKRSPSKHTLLIVNAPFRAWEAPAVKSMSPGTGAGARAVQVIASAAKDGKITKAGEQTLFVQALLTGLSGAADLNHNGWLTASELGTYIQEQVEAVSLRIDGDGDTVLLQHRKADPVLEPQQRPNDREAAKNEYDQALAQLQGGKYADEALARLNRAIEYDPTFAEAYLLKSYLRLEVLPQLDEALVAGQQAVKHAPDNADAFYTLGQVHEKMGHYEEAEHAYVQAAKLNPKNPDVYFSLGTLYEDQLNDNAKAIEAFRRYLDLGGAHARARAAVSLADSAGLTPANSAP